MTERVRLIGLLLLAAAVISGCGGTKPGVKATSEDAGPQYQIGVVVAQDGDPVQLTSGEADNGLAAFQPDGAAVVFTSNRDGRWQVYQHSLSDGSESRLVESEANDEAPRWLPDGSGLIFTSDRSGGGDYARDIYILDPTTGETRQLTTSSGDEWGATPIAGDSRYLYLASTGAGGDEDLYREPVSVMISGLDGSGGEPVVGGEKGLASPVIVDETTILCRTRDGHLARFNRSDESLVPLLPGSLQVGSLAYSQEKGIAALTVSKNGEDYRLCLFNPATSMLQDLGDATSDAHHPQFSVDGSMVVFSRRIEGHHQLFLQKLTR